MIQKVDSKLCVNLTVLLLTASIRLGFISKIEAEIKINETSVGRNIIFKKVRIVICDIENKYKFCGLPSGVNILPKFAAIVCITIIGISNF